MLKAFEGKTLVSLFSGRFFHLKKEFQNGFRLDHQDSYFPFTDLQKVCLPFFRLFWFFKLSFLIDQLLFPLLDLSVFDNGKNKNPNKTKISGFGFSYREVDLLLKIFLVSRVCGILRSCFSISLSSLIIGGFLFFLSDLV